MRLFLINWAIECPELVEVALELQNRGHEILYWVRSDDYVKVDRNLFPRTIFHELNDANAGIPPFQLKTNNFEPLGEKIIRQLSDRELVFLSLMDKNYISWSTHQKKQFYYDLLKYWCGAINLFKPEAIIFNTLPHNPYTFAVYVLAKLFKIKTIFFDEILPSDRVLLYNHIGEESPRLKTEIEKTSNDFSFDDLNQDIKKHYLFLSGERDIYCQTNAAEDSVLLKRASYWGEARYKMGIISTVIKRGRLIYYIGELLKKSKDNLRKEYQKLQVDFDSSFNYVYFPLQFQPEASSCPCGSVFNNQLLALEILSAAIPRSWIIYVKEHPGSWPLSGAGFYGYRFKGYYGRIAKFKNVKIVPVAIKSWQMIKYAKAIATLTGTAGWEALLREKPILVFGWPFYKSGFGVFKVNDVISCRYAIEKISAGYKVKRQEIVNFLVALDRASFHGCLTANRRKFLKITAEENKRNFLEAILRELKYN